MRSRSIDASCTSLDFTILHRRIPKEPDVMENLKNRRNSKEEEFIWIPRTSLKTKMDETQEEIFTSSDEADARRRDEEAGGGDFVTLTPEVLDLEENVKMDFSRKMDDWSGRGSRSRDSSTSVSESDKREQFDEFKAMVQTLAMGVQNSTAA